MTVQIYFKMYRILKIYDISSNVEKAFYIEKTYSSNKIIFTRKKNFLPLELNYRLRLMVSYSHIYTKD